MSCIEVIVEIAKGSHIKYEYDKEKDMLICDRILYTPFKYPFNYGFIPKTLSEDGDPLDVVILMEDELIPGCCIKCEILGYIDTEDDEGNDPKMILCPIAKIDPSVRHSYLKNGIDQHTIEKIKYFFQHYKDLENKKVRVGDFYDSSKAIEIYNQSIERYKNTHSQNSKITDFFYKDK